jgi:hypothetical protein
MPRFGRPGNSWLAVSPALARGRKGKCPANGNVPIVRPSDFSHRVSNQIFS